MIFTIATKVKIITSVYNIIPISFTTASYLLPFIDLIIIFSHYIFISVLILWFLDLFICNRFFIIHIFTSAFIIIDIVSIC